MARTTKPEAAAADHRPARAPRPDPHHRHTLPGRAAGPAPGRQGPGPGRGGRGPHRQARRRSPRSTPRRSSAPGRPRRRSPRRSGCGCSRTGPARVRLRRLDRAPSSRTSTSCPSGAPCSATRAGSASPAASRSPRCRPASPRRWPRWPPRTGARPSWPCPTPIPIKAAVADALGTHLDLFQRIVISPCSVSAIWYATAGPGRAGRQLHRRRPDARWACRDMSTSFELRLEPDHFTAGAVGEPGGGCSTSRPARPDHVVTPPPREAAGRGAGRVPGRHPRRPAPTPRPLPGDARPDRAGDRRVGRRALAVAYEEADDRILLVAEELIVVDEDDVDEADRRRSVLAARRRPPPASA